MPRAANVLLSSRNWGKVNKWKVWQKVEEAHTSCSTQHCCGPEFESAGQLGAFYVEFARSFYVCVASFCVFELPPTVQRHVSLTGESKLAVGVNMIINAFGRSVLALWWTSACTLPRAQSCDRLKASTPYVPEIDTRLRKLIIGPCRLLFFLHYHVCCCTLSYQNRTGSAHAPASSPGNTRCLHIILWNSTLKLMGYICLADISSCPARHSIAKRSTELMRSW